MSATHREYTGYILMKFGEQLQVRGIQPGSGQYLDLYLALQRAIKAADEFKALAETIQRTEK